MQALHAFASDVLGGPRRPRPPRAPGYRAEEARRVLRRRSRPHPRRDRGARLRPRAAFLHARLRGTRRRRQPAPVALVWIRRRERAADAFHLRPDPQGAGSRRAALQAVPGAAHRGRGGEYLALGGGSLEEATALYEAAIGYANDVGLFAEEILPETGEALGNFPQGFTHVGVVNAALTIEERRKGSARPARAAGAAR